MINRAFLLLVFGYSVYSIYAVDITLKIDDIGSISVLSGIDNTHNVRDLTELTIPQIDKIGDDAFKHYSKLKSVNFSDHSLCNSIGKRAFYRCKALENFQFGTGGHGVEIIDDHAFDSCSNLKKIDIPYTLKKVGMSAFNGCDKLKEIDLSGEVREIGDSAFFLCKSLEHVKFGHNLERVGSSAFYGCENIISIDLNVEDVGKHAFEGCLKLKDINLSSVKNIGEYAFRGCTNLKNVVLSYDEVSVDNGVFEGCTSLETVYTGVIAFYNAIKNGAFSDCKNLKKIDIKVDAENSVQIKNIPASWDEFIKKIAKKQVRAKVIEAVDKYLNSNF